MATFSVADGTTIFFTDHGGSGDAVLLVHGITESSDTWTPVADRLQANHRVISMDLRGHGESGFAARYDLEAMASDVVAVIQELGLGSQVHLVGHSLGGAVVSAVGAAVPVASVVNVDQSLQLGAFKTQLVEVEAMLKDASTFGVVIDQIFAQMVGTMLHDVEATRLGSLRRADQQVVLGVWELLFAMSESDITAVIDEALAGYAGSTMPYLSLFGIDPGTHYQRWLGSKVPDAQVELWVDHGHYPHLVDPDRFVQRLTDFWMP